MYSAGGSGHVGLYKQHDNEKTVQISSSMHMLEKIHVPASKCTFLTDIVELLHSKQWSKCRTRLWETSASRSRC